MTNSLTTTIKKLCLEPGLLFPVASIFVFAQIDNPPALVFAIVNAVFSTIAIFKTYQKISPLRITMWMVLLSALCALWNGDIFPDLAGLMFASGHFMITSSNIKAWRGNPAAPSVLKAITHPALYYGFGYCMTGMMAGGGLKLIQHPLDNKPALLMVSLGITTILTASFGLAFNLMKSAVPYWILATGTAVNAIAGFIVGNMYGGISCLFSVAGEMRLAYLAREQSNQTKQE